MAKSGAGRWAPLAAALVAAAVVAALVARREPAPDEAGPPPAADGAAEAGPRSAAERPDVVLLTVDTLRADALGAYGSDLGLTPTMDAIAARGTVFERALATSSWTVPSVASLVTGRHPEEHGADRGVVEAGQVVGQPGLPRSLVTLAETFREGGYATAAVLANAHLGGELGYREGFDHFRNLGFSSARGVIKWLERNRAELGQSDRPRFVWIHLFDPHHPYLVHERDFARLLPPEVAAGDGAARAEALARELAGLSMAELLARTDLEPGSPGLAALRAAYLGEVAHTDRALARVLELLEVDPDRALVVLTADHGEELRDHGLLGHRVSLYSELVRVPLVVSWPGHLPEGARVSEAVSLLDLYPTLADLAGLRPPPGLRGQSLVRGDALAAPEGRALVSSVWFQDRFVRSVSAGRHRLVVDELGDRAELYDEEADPGDTTDLADDLPEATAALRALLEERFESLEPVPDRPAPHAADPELLERLRALGYVE